MAEDVKADEVIEQLRDSFARQIATTIRDLPAHQALQVADALCTIQLETLAGMRVLYKAAPKVDGEAITEAWRRGIPVDEIRRVFKVSKATAYKYHPNANSPRRERA